MDQIHLIQIMAINEKSLPRDRTALDPDAQFELQSSIATSGLRMPIEAPYRLPPPKRLPRGTPLPNTPH